MESFNKEGSTGKGRLLSITGMKLFALGGSENLVERVLLYIWPLEKLRRVNGRMENLFHAELR